MDIILFVLALIFALKSTAIVQALFWMKRHGEEYRKRWIAKTVQVRSEWYDLLDLCNGRFFPFGFKDYRLRRDFESSDGFLARIKAIFYSFAFRYIRLVVICSAALCLISCWSQTNDAWMVIKPEPLGVCCLGFAIWIIVMNILLAYEAISSYVFLGSYAVLFHALPIMRNANRRSPDVLLETKVLRDRLLLSLVSGATACFIAQVRFKAFTGHALMPIGECDWTSAVAAFLQFVYFTITTMLTIGYGDISPANGVGQFVAVLLMIQGFSIIVLAFSFLMAIGFRKSP